MVTSSAQTVDEYLEQLPEDRRQSIAAVRDVIQKNLPPGFSEMMLGGMIAYGIPLANYPNTYNRQPLCYAALAAQKNYNTLYLMRPYGDPEELKRLQEGFAAAGKKLDMGKSCIHFKKTDDLPLDVIAKSIGGTNVERWIKIYEASRRKR
jgi:hypothetical protein